MGFLGFLKKSKEKGVVKSVSELEFPPLPSEEELFGDEEELEIPSPPPFLEEKMKEKEEKEEAIEEMPELPEPEVTKGVEVMPMPQVISKAEKELKLRPRKALYVKINRYKAVLGELKLSRNRLTEAEQALERISGLKVFKDKEFEKWREGLEDLQRKLIFVDRTIFGG
jgi:hypothetical protein